MVGLLYALPNTQLTRRLEKEGRLHPPLKREDRMDLEGADQCTMGLNFATIRPRQEILTDYVHILERIYDPVAFAGRLERLAKMLNNCGRRPHLRRNLGKREMSTRIISNIPEPRDLFAQTLTRCVASNPSAARRILLLMALYMDVGPFSRDLIARIENMIATIDASERAWNSGCDQTVTRLALGSALDEGVEQLKPRWVGPDDRAVQNPMPIE
jgi:hypothetical protein